MVLPLSKTDLPFLIRVALPPSLSLLTCQDLSPVLIPLITSNLVSVIIVNDIIVVNDVILVSNAITINNMIAISEIIMISDIMVVIKVIIISHLFADPSPHSYSPTAAILLGILLGTSP